VPDYDHELAEIVAELNRAAPGGAPRESGPQHEAAAATSAISHTSSSLDQLLVHAVGRRASDLLVIAGAPVSLRVGGTLTPAAGPALSAEQTRNLLLPLLTHAQHQELSRTKSVDLCFSRDGIGRFRANIHHQRGSLSGSFRLLPESIPTLESLHLPAALRKLAEARQGLVLITGPTGCGKSSTLAAMVDLINSIRRHHVVTIEDPIEFVHSNRNSFV
jgi:twitching motility protein PilT